MAAKGITAGSTRGSPKGSRVGSLHLVPAPREAGAERRIESLVPRRLGLLVLAALAHRAERRTGRGAPLGLVLAVGVLGLLGRTPTNN